MAYTCPYGKFQKKREAFGVQTALNVFLNLMFKLFLKYLENFLLFLMDNSLISIQTKEECLKQLQFVFEKF